MTRYLSHLCVLATFLIGGMGLSSCLEFHTKTYHVGVSLGSGSRHHRQMTKEMEREADNDNCIILDARIAEGDVERQLEDIRDLADGDLDLLIVCALDPVTMTPEIEKLFNKGIPVLLVDNLLTNDSYTAFIGSDYYDMGRMMGDYLEKQVKARGNVIVLSGGTSKQAVQAGSAGIFSIIREMEHLHPVKQIEAEDAPTVTREMESVLKGEIHIDYILSENYELASGALEAMKKTGAEKIPVLTGDVLGYNSEAVKALNEGKLSAVVESVTNGERVLRLAREILEGGHFQRYNNPTVNVLDARNTELLSTLSAEMEAEKARRDEVNDGYDELVTSIQKHRNINILIAVLIFILMLSVWLLIRYLNKRKKHLDELSTDKKYVEKERSELKSRTRQQSLTLEQGRRFVSSVSHDLRAPLTLIIEPMRRLQASEKLSPEDRQLVELMAPNVRMQYRLVRQLSDIMNYRRGTMRLELEKFDFAETIGYWLDQFAAQAVPKHLTFTSKFEEGDYTMEGDSEKIVRLVYDLLGYSFKFTPVNGSVSFHAAIEEKGDGRRLVITIADTGIGIQKGTKLHFFESYKSDNNTAGSSAMGLMLAKYFTELHHGRITVASNPKGRGTVVTVKLPMHQPNTEGTARDAMTFYHEEEEQLAREMMKIMTDVTSQETPTMQHDVIVTVEEESDTSNGLDAQDSKPEILIVENSHSMRKYLHLMLSGEYNVTDATNGQEALQLTMHRMPALVITESLMPVMDGIELCKRLKSDAQTAHIPVIMVTAYFDQERLEQAYTAGVDSFIPKPFQGEVLKAAIQSILDNRERMRVRYGKDNEDKHEFTVKEKTWVEKLYRYIREHLSDPGFTVEEMGRASGLGRVQFYRRCKQLTGYSPNELIRNMRLKRAFTLLSTTDMTISEVAYSVGFASPSYFTRCYRDHFGQTPKERIKDTK